MIKKKFIYIMEINDNKEIKSPERNCKKIEKNYFSSLINRKKENHLIIMLKKIIIEIKLRKKPAILDLNSTNNKFKYMINKTKAFVPITAYSNNNSIINEI